MTWPAGPGDLWHPTVADNLVGKMVPFLGPDGEKGWATVEAASVSGDGGLLVLQMRVDEQL